MQQPLRIYIAGPYCPKDCSLHEAPVVAQRNVDKAIEVAMELFGKGHYAFVPHLSHYLNIHHSRKKEFTADFYYKYDITFLEHWAEALFFISESPGANHELHVAIKLGLIIYDNLEVVPCVTIK